MLIMIHVSHATSQVTEILKKKAFSEMSDAQ